MTEDLDNAITNLIKFDQKFRVAHINVNLKGRQEVNLKLSVIDSLVKTIKQILATSQGQS